MLESSLHDVRHAARGLVRSPLFTLVAVLSIAVGVGATTAIVTLANTLLFRPPAGVGHPDRVVTVGRTQDGAGFDNMSYPNFVDLRAAATTLSGLAAVRGDPMPASLAGPSGAEPVDAGVVSGNFFEILEARPHAGRFFLPEEDVAPGRNPVVVLRHGFWRERFNADRSVVGSTIVLNGTPFTVVGVAEPGFQGPFVMAPDLWMPVMASALAGSDGMLQNRFAVWHVAIGRLAPGASITTAQAELGAVSAGLEQAYPQANRGKGVRVMPASIFPGQMRTMVGGFMAVLLVVAGLVLVIASTNVAGMLLARAASRQREIAVRLAIGASRRQLIRRLLTESLLLFLVAGTAGVLLAPLLVDGLLALVPRLPMQLIVTPELDLRVLVIALAVTLVTGLAAGLVPALQGTSLGLASALRSETGGTGRRQRLRSSLLVAQIAFSTLLLVAAGLFARTLAHARSIDPGFEAEGVQVAAMDFELARYDEARGLQLAATILDRARVIPQARSAALSAMLPLSGGKMGLGGIEVEGRPAPNGDSNWDPHWNIVTPGYFTTLGIPLLQGRDFTTADRAGGAYVAILNETFARNLFPGQEPIGRTIRNGDRVVTVIGISRDGKYQSLGESPQDAIYVPQAQWYSGRMTLLVRTAPGAAAGPAIRRLIAGIDPALPILNLASLEDLAAAALFPQRVALAVAGILGGVALLLALLGIYGVTSYSVAQRTREIGVRVALGANETTVLRMVLRQGLVLAGIGVVLGSLAAAAVMRLIVSLLYGIAPTDALAFGGAAALLAGAALAASWIPARRAARIDPMVALRSD